MEYGRGECCLLRVPLRQLWCGLLTLTLAGRVFAAAELQRFTNVQLVENPSNDGDSFVVKEGDRQLHLRLYFVDCPESVATTDADAKRVREQAFYFGIANAKRILEFGREAKEFTARTLAKPFTIHTAFASALGRSPGGRVYAFVTTADGKDLARLLVENGYARAYGTKRTRPDGTGVEEIQKALQDLEAEAMLEHRGVWAATDAGVLEKLRAQGREEERELKDLIKESASEQKAKPGSVDLNTASAHELQSVRGIGVVLAGRIMAGRPYEKVEDLRRVSGIGTKLFEKIRPYLTVTKSTEKKSWFASEKSE